MKQRSTDSTISFNPPKLKIVVLQNPTATWSQSRTQELFSQLIQLKHDGYALEYSPGVTPYDAADFIGTHLIICEEGERGQLKPVVAYKSLTLEEADFHRILFTPRGILSSSNQDTERLESIIRNARDSGTRLSYDNAWTMLPSVRKNREYSKMLRDLTTTIGVFYHYEFQIPEWLVIGIVRFKTDQYFRWMGHKEITPEFPFFSSYDEPAYLLHLNSYSKESQEIAERYKRMWDEKLVIGPDQTFGKSIKAA